MTRTVRVVMMMGRNRSLRGLDEGVLQGHRAQALDDEVEVEDRVLRRESYSGGAFRGRRKYRGLRAQEDDEDEGADDSQGHGEEEVDRVAPRIELGWPSRGRRGRSPGGRP